ncbi:Hypothetical_protein [Hexamita inflata]|uniref:Hypothetical_protein n=1 Tax=Hexamita inflata TaxID=28002 RepID=A0AA86QEE3_9EUKA|nr:Hypothetical protein HINF_LOCUS44188 [Hexamita inflata]
MCQQSCSIICDLEKLLERHDAVIANIDTNFDDIISSLRKLNTETAHFAIERIKVRLVGSDNLLMKAIKLKQFLQQNQKTIIYHYYLAQFRVLTSYLKRYYLQLTLKTQFFIMNHQQLKMFNMVVHQIYGMLDLKEIRVFNLQLIIFND